MFMKTPRVICVGEILFDRLSSEPANSLQKVKSWQDFPGGAPANTACALAKLGIPTAFIGCIGQDEPGEMLVKLLKDSKVDCTGVQRHITAPTRIIYLLRDKIGNSKLAGFGDRDTAEFADAYLNAELLPGFLFEEIEFLVLGTLELAYPNSKKAIYETVNLAKSYNAKVFLDVNWEQMFWKNPDAAFKTIWEFIRHVDFLKLTVDEAQFLFGSTQPKAIAEYFSNIKGVLVTASEQGCTYYLGGNEGQLPAFSVEVQDTTGAGDAFNAGVIYQLCDYGIQSLANPEITRKIVTYASAVGALTTTRLGAITAQPTPIEVRDFLRNHRLEEYSIT